jgi:hypothetical protein
LFNQPDSPFQRAANLLFQRSGSALASIAAGDLASLGIQGLLAKVLSKWPPRSHSSACKIFRAPMLPGFRFLFAAIMLSASLLVFGLGAASLFRAAHQAFASNPSWRGAADLTFAQKGEMAAPVLATLRVDPPRLDKPQSEVAVVPQAAPPVEPAKLEGEGAPGQIAAPGPADTRPTELADPDGVKAELPAAQNPPAIETAEPATELAAKSDQTKVAAVETADEPPGKSDPAIAPLEPTPTEPNPTPTSPSAAAEPSNTPAKIATLGDPTPEAVQDNPGNDNAAKSDSAKPDQNAIQKRQRARRAAQRRRLAARARLAAQQLLLQQQQNDPFAQPFPPLTPIPPPAPAPIRRAPKRINHAAPVATGGPPA